MNKKKRVGYFKTLQDCRFDHTIFNFHFDSDLDLPILGNGKLTRLEIYKILWGYLAEVFAEQHLPKTDYEKPQHWLLINLIITSFSEILAYPLSQKKISGLGAKTKAIESVEFDDKILPSLERVNGILKEIKITETHKKFYPPISKEISELINYHEQSVRQYIWAYKREERFLQKCGESIDLLRGSGISNFEIKQILKEALVFFKSKKLNIYIKSLDRILNKKFYTRIHHQGFSEDGEFWSAYSIEKVSSKNKDPK